MQITSHSAESIRAMSYNELIGLIRETNRTPGGNETVFQVARRLFINPHSNVLDIGTSTGATALEFSRLTGCSVTGIDINEQSLIEACRRASALGANRVRFERHDARALPFADASFDLVFCGNVTSLIDEGERAFAEYRRVVRFGGYVCAVPMYYVENPPADMVDDVRAAIKVPIEIKFRDDAVGFFSSPDLELYDTIDFRFHNLPEQRVIAFSEKMLRQPHLQVLSQDAQAALQEVYTRYLLLFRRNLSYMGYTIVILRRAAFQEDPVLFTSSRS